MINNNQKGKKMSNSSSSMKSIMEPTLSAHQELPIDLWIDITKHLNTRDKGSEAQISKKLKDAANDNYSWYINLQHNFPYKVSSYNNKTVIIFFLKIPKCCIMVNTVYGPII